MSESPPSEIPQEIGGYRIEGLLNRGGMSLLYLGVHPKTRKPITIKVLSAKYINNPEVVEQFLHEAKIIEITNHPNIVKLYGHGKWEGGVYIAMEFVQGISLRQMILQQAMPLKRSLEIILQIAHALMHLHVHGIIHRDLKPENILLTAEGGIKVIDFGISRLYTAPGAKQMMGTPSYMAPELRANFQNASFSSDLFALGIIAYELILGRLCHGSIHLAMVPRGLQPVLAKALQPDPKKRYDDIVDFVQAVSNYLSSKELKQDMRGSDYIGELNEDLKEAQSLLLPRELPKWKKVELGFASNCNMAVSAVYYDFFQRRDGVHHVVMSESLSSGVKGLLEIAMLRGMLYATAATIEDPVELVSALNKQILDLDQEHAFAFSFLSLFPNEGRFSFIACGHSSLWYLPAGATKPRRLESENLALGLQKDAKFLEVDSSWAIGGSLILHTFQAGVTAESEVDEKRFARAFEQHLTLPPQQQADGIFRTVTQTDFNKPLTIVCLERTS